MEVMIPFGDEILKVKAPKGSLVIEPHLLSGIPDPERAMAEVLRHPTGTPPLHQLARDRSSAAIVINDVTRPSPSRQMLAALLQELAKANLPEKAVTVVIASGYHRMTTQDELLQMLGRDLLGRLRILNHDSLDGENQVFFGMTERGLPIYVNRRVAQAELKILTGIITPHQVAGYSGGRKSIIPGVAGFETIRRHHSPPIRPLEPVMGIMKGNSFHEEAVAGAKRVEIDFILNVVKNARGELVSIVAGDLEKAHEQGVLACEKAWKTSISERCEIVVVSPGHYPKDIDLHQAQKALSVAEQVAAPNGVIILVGECRAGIGKFKPWMESAKNPQEIIDRFLREGFTRDHSSKAFLCARALVHHKVIVVCRGIPAKDLEAMFFEHASTVEIALKKALALKGKEARILFLPHATDCVPAVESD